MGKLRDYFLNHYPRTDFHELNQDWMITMLYDMINQVENFVEMNSVKYADPIQWSITSQYEKNTIVVDAITGTAYISSKPVPMGVALSRTEYWSVIFDLSRFITLASQNFANSYEAVLTTTATMPTNKDKWLVWDSILYRAKNDIHVGDMYVVDGNIEKYTVEMFFDELVHLIAEETEARIEADTALHDEIVNESVARENADNTLQDNIDALQDNIDAEATARENADEALQDNIDAEAAVRENADEELRLLMAQSNFGSRKFIFIGDSYGWGSNYSDPTTPIPSYIDYFVQYLRIPSTNYYRNCAGGYGFGRAGYTFESLLADLNDVIANKDTITDIIVCGGANDAPENVYPNVESGINSFCNYAKVHYPNALISIGMIGYNYEGSESNYRMNRILNVYNKAAILNNAVYLNGIENSIHSTDCFQADGHPNEKGQKQIGRALVSCVRTGSCTIFNENQLANAVEYDSIWSSESPAWGTLFTCQHDNTVEIVNNNFINISLNEPISVSNSEFSDYIKIGHLSNTHIIGAAFQFTKWSAPVCLYLTTGENSGCIGEFYINNRDLYMRVYNSKKQSYSFGGVRICPFTAVFSARFC